MYRAVIIRTAMNTSRTTKTTPFCYQVSSTRLQDPGNRRLFPLPSSSFFSSSVSPSSSRPTALSCHRRRLPSACCCCVRRRLSTSGPTMMSSRCARHRRRRLRRLLGGTLQTTAVVNVRCANAISVARPPPAEPCVLRVMAASNVNRR